MVVVTAETLVVAGRLLASPAFAPDRRGRPHLPPDALEILALASGAGPAGEGIDFGARLHGIGDAECGDGEFLLAVRAMLLGHCHGRPKDEGSHHLNVSGGNEGAPLCCVAILALDGDERGVLGSREPHEEVPAGEVDMAGIPEADGAVALCPLARCVCLGVG